MQQHFRMHHSPQSRRRLGWQDPIQGAIVHGMRSQEKALERTPGKRDSIYRIAIILRAAPGLADIARTLFRITQARFSAGVVGVVLNRQSQVLLVEHLFHPRTPWGLPGGWLEPGEDPARALDRELGEELGITIEIIQPLLIKTGHYFRNHLDIAYLCRSLDDVRWVSSELRDYRWQEVEHLPALAPFHQASIDAWQLQDKGK